MSKIFTLGRTITGKTPSTKVKENWGNDIPFYAPEDIAKGYILDDAIRHVSNQGFNAIKNKTTDGISVLVGCIGSDMGNSAIVERKCAFNQQINAITDFDKDVNPFYVYYYLSTQKDYLRQLAGSTTTPLLPKSDFEQIDIPLPDKYTQDKTVRVLKPIDDKIKNNTAICSDLESMAKLLYDYWFVQFDFPDENGKPYKSSGGKMVWNEELKREIPLMWNNGKISDLGEIVGGGTPSTKHEEYYAKKGIAWATPKDLADNPNRFFTHGERDISDTGLNNSSAVLMPCGTVLMTSRAPIGYLAISKNVFSTNQGFKSIIPDKRFGADYVYFTLDLLMPYIMNYGTGSTFSEISKSDLESIPTIIPDTKTLSRFIQKVQSITDLIYNLEEENKQLASLRDFLLPMLMNGQVKVKEGETQ